jgi:hypothetical protein
MPLQATSGAASYDAFGGGAAAVPPYIEDVFSTWLYTGTGGAQTITNGINLSGNGGLVWVKSRNAATGNNIVDTVRGAGQTIYSESATNQGNNTGFSVSAFGTTGFTVTENAFNDYGVNQSGNTYTSWTFREQSKFFDIVTWTGNGANRTIAHNLGSVPGCIMVKRTDAIGAWQVYHRSLANTQYMVLNTTAAATTGATRWNSTTPTSTVFSLGTDATVNASGGTYVAYVYAHDAGGFGLTGTDNVISCGSVVLDGSGNGNVNLGYEPQWILAKQSSTTSAWQLTDTMRGMPVSGNTSFLEANTSAAEDVTGSTTFPTATGFKLSGASFSAGATVIYIAIRRGPMKVPTTGTSVLGLSARSGTNANATVTGSAGVTDLAIIKNRGSTPVWAWASRLTGTGYLSSNATTAETAAGTTILQANPWDVMDGIKVGTTSTITNASSNTFINYLIDRAPGFMDVVCYTQSISTGTQTINHNLGVAPQLVIIKTRSVADSWKVGSSLVSGNCPLNSEVAFSGTSPVNTLTSTTFGFNAGSHGFSIGTTYVSYLFTTCAGVSKVGTYTGTGTTQTINCGFSSSARFVLIKRTDEDISTGISGPWYVWDSARGIVAGNDPYLLLNSTAAEVTNTDFVDTAATGFEISSTAPAAINASGGAFIFLAIA